jgi:hypothetical protein
MGGVGNQMFQYALGKALAIKNKTDLVLDLTSFVNNDNRIFLLDQFNTNINKVHINKIPYHKRELRPNKIISKLSKYFNFGLNVYSEPHFHYDPNVLFCKDQSYICGYWQSEKYFEKIKEIIFKEFRLKTPLDSNSNEYFDIINRTNSVAVHVRRCDYKNNERLYLLNEDYYSKAFNFVLKNVKNADFYIFSDDINWCKEHFRFDIPFKFVESKNDLIDFELMRLCKHHIIANSTFSWWSAYLSENHNQIKIAPLNWFKPNTKYLSNDIYFGKMQIL